MEASLVLCYLSTENRVGGSIHTHTHVDCSCLKKAAS